MKMVISKYMDLKKKPTTKTAFKYTNLLVSYCLYYAWEICVFNLKHILAWKYFFVELSSRVFSYCGGVECTQWDIELVSIAYVFSMVYIYIH